MSYLTADIIIILWFTDCGLQLQPHTNLLFILNCRIRATFFCRRTFNSEFRFEFFYSTLSIFPIKHIFIYSIHISSENFYLYFWQLFLRTIQNWDKRNAEMGWIKNFRPNFVRKPFIFYYSINKNITSQTQYSKNFNYSNLLLAHLAVRYE